MTPSTKLFQELETQFASTKLGDDKWYICATAAMVGGPDPESVADLYSHLISQPRYSTSDARQALIRRIREALVKAISVVGVCKPIEAIIAISKLERDEDQDLSCSREDWHNDEANRERGVGYLQRVYKQNIGPTLDLFNAHRDFRLISTDITYGLYLSDRSILNDVETQLVTLPCIMIQNLPNETHWHIRGTRRIGVSKEDVQTIWNCIQMIADFSGVKLTKVPTVESVESDV